MGWMSAWRCAGRRSSSVGRGRWTPSWRTCGRIGRRATRRRRRRPLCGAPAARLGPALEVVVKRVVDALYSIDATGEMHIRRPVRDAKQRKRGHSSQILQSLVEIPKLKQLGLSKLRGAPQSGGRKRKVEAISIDIGGDEDNPICLDDDD